MNGLVRSIAIVPILRIPTPRAGVLWMSKGDKSDFRPESCKTLRADRQRSALSEIVYLCGISFRGFYWPLGASRKPLSMK